MIELLIGQIWPYVLGAIALLGGWLAARQSGKQAGRREVEQEHEAQNLDAIRKANANREKVTRMDDDSQLAEFDRLRAARREKRG